MGSWRWQASLPTGGGRSERSAWVRIDFRVACFMHAAVPRFLGSHGGIPQDHLASTLFPPTLQGCFHHAFTSATINPIISQETSNEQWRQR
jgi:hypothetical protein